MAVEEVETGHQDCVAVIPRMCSKCREKGVGSHALKGQTRHKKYRGCKIGGWDRYVKHIWHCILDSILSMRSSQVLLRLSCCLAVACWYSLKARSVERWRDFHASSCSASVWPIWCGGYAGDMWGVRVRGVLEGGGHARASVLTRFESSFGQPRGHDACRRSSDKKKKFRRGGGE